VSYEPPHPADQPGIKPPHSLDAERECLAAAFISDIAMDKLAAKLTPAALYDERHQRIYRAMLALHGRTVPIDIVTVSQEMRDLGTYDAAGGGRAVSGLLDRAGTVSNLEHYIGIVLEKATRRRIQLAAKQLDVAVHSYNDGDLEAAILEVEEAKQHRIDTLAPTESWALATRENVAALDDDAPPRKVISSGIGPLDHHLPGGGFEAGWLVVAIAPPKVGKTSFAFGNVTRPVLEKGGSVLYAALSDAGVRRLNLKMLCAVSGVPDRAVKRRDMTSNQHQAWAAAADTIQGWKLQVERLRSARDIALCAHTMSRRVGLDLVVVDYIQRVRNGERESHQDIAVTMSTLQDLAADLQVPVLALSQPSLDARRNKKTITAADAKGSGAIEEDADLLLSLLRGKDGAGGIAVLPSREAQEHVWPAEDQTVGGRLISACGWRWDSRTLRLEVP